MVLETDQSHGQRTPQAEHDRLDMGKLRRQQHRDMWDAYWKVMDLESKGTVLPRMKYYLHKFMDVQITWFRENVAEPLQDRFKLPYYQRRISRVPDIDECAPVDLACIWQANEQYRFDKHIDGEIVDILDTAVTNCMQENLRDMSKCANLIEQFEEAELNFFIKYGELGASQDARHCLMKQKHRMIWERRHPEIMNERERLYKEHKEQLAHGHFDLSFWKRGVVASDPTYRAPYQLLHDDAPFMRHPPQSKDPQYYKQQRQQGKTGDEFDETLQVSALPWLPKSFKTGAKAPEESKTTGAESTHAPTSEEATSGDNNVDAPEE